MKIGSHVSMNGSDYLLGSVKEALSYNSNTFMIYTGAPQNTRRQSLDKLKIKEAHELMKQRNINPDDIVVHAPYIINLANKNPEKRQFAADFLTEEVKRTDAIGAKQIVLHPGAHVRQGVELGIKHIVEGLNKVIENTKDSDVSIALETMAGKGTEVGRTFEELKRIIDGVVHPERLTVCFDTCHTHDAGYKTKEDFDGVIEEFDRIIGKDRISVFHINDSKNIIGASKDRHENLGYGQIGFDALRYVVIHEDFTHIPKILETPHITKTDETKKRLYPPYKEEIEMFRSGIYNPKFRDNIRKQQQ
ncbi:MAG: deoxyribonuclease IV [Candidatus Izimaplasma sp.]|nr:deoxyribonuclease IV [Candidatus Izimaplasma bacterium]